jgi:transcriptional regulatory protein RtcR
MKTTVVSLLGTRLDAPRLRGKDRWNAWRPNVALAMQEDIHFDEFHLVHGRNFRKLALDVAADIRTASPDTDVRLDELAIANPWDFEEVYARLYDYARDKGFADPARARDSYVHITTGTHVEQICLFLLNESHHLPGWLIQTSPNAGPAHRPASPRGSCSVIDLELGRYDAIARRFEAERRGDLVSLKGGIATRNAAFNALVETVERVAVRSADPILLTGPTGAGKSLLARRIYDLKRAKGRLKGAFVDLNCATLRGDQAMSALFGHRKGAYTGAAADRPGLLKAADGGLLFLDEVGELGADEQAMLLRAIEEKRFLPLGSDAEAASDFQLICGTNRDLGAAVAAGRFREDLLARIDLWTFRLPGLAERREDIEPNLDWELERWAARTGMRLSFSKEARERFLAWALDPGTPWTGNFREFNATVTRIATLADGGRVTVADVEAEIARAAAARAAPAAAVSPADAILARCLGPGYAAAIDRFDLAQLRDVVDVCRRSRTLAEAARTLFAVSRLAKKTANDTDRLSKYLARHGLAFRDLAR